MAKLEMPQRMVEWSLWALWWLIIGSAVIWVVVGSAGYWVRLGWVPDATASWAQALGSMLAVVVALAVPVHLWYRERDDKAIERDEQDQARTAQLIALCSEGVDVICSFDHEAVAADYDITNALRRAVLNDLLARLNEAQRAELNAARMQVAMQLRFSIHDWMKYFGGAEVTDVGQLHYRVERSRPALERILTDANNILLSQRGLPVIDTPVDTARPEDDVPW